MHLSTKDDAEYIKYITIAFTDRPNYRNNSPVICIYFGRKNKLRYNRFFIDGNGNRECMRRRTRQNGDGGKPLVATHTRK